MFKIIEFCFYILLPFRSSLEGDVIAVCNSSSQKMKIVIPNELFNVNLLQLKLSLKVLPRYLIRLLPPMPKLHVIPYPIHMSN